jgi:hypothetical protein
VLATLHLSVIDSFSTIESLLCVCGCMLAAIICPFEPQLPYFSFQIFRADETQVSECKLDCSRFVTSTCDIPVNSIKKFLIVSAGLLVEQ